MEAFGQHAEAWTEFWREQKADAGCCVRAPDIRRSISGHWQSVARALPSGSKILDLCCGSGAAGLALVDANPAVHAIGVDFASVPASAERRFEILANTRIESLPFTDGSFDGAISQFGFEYGSLELASRELGRVLRPGSPLSFLVHHAEGRIVVDSRLHRQALAAICSPELESAFLSGSVTLLSQQLSSIRRRFPYERLVDDAERGLRRHIFLPSAQRVQIWQAVKAALEPELIMLADLEDAAVSAEQMPAWLQKLAPWFEILPTKLLSIAGGQPLCWQIEGVRRPALH